jgi:hypothetical protein
MCGWELVLPRSERQCHAVLPAEAGCCTCCYYWSLDVDINSGLESYNASLEHVTGDVYAERRSKLPCANRSRYRPHARPHPRRCGNHMGSEEETTNTAHAERSIRNTNTRTGTIRCKSRCEGTIRARQWRNGERQMGVTIAPSYRNTVRFLKQ